MISSIEIQNFKSLKQISLSLKKINIFLGPNGTGKSSVLQAIIFLKQMMDRSLQEAYRGPYIDFIDFKETIFKQNITDNFQFNIRIGLSDEETARIKNRLKAFSNIVLDNHSIKEIGFGVNIAISGIGKSDITIDDNLLMWSQRNEEARSDIIDLKQKNITISPENQNLLLFGFSGNTEEISRVQQTSTIVIEFIKQRFARLYSLPVARGMFHQQYQFRKRPQDLIGEIFDQGGERIANIITYMKVQPPLEEKLEECKKWMSEFGLDFRPYLISDQYTKTEGYDTKLNIWTNIIHQGFGTNQLIPIVIMGVLAPTNSTLLVEEPEIHLHPRMQANIVDFFIDEIANKGKQAIITSHSEHILLRIQRRIAEGMISKDDVAIYFFTKDSNGSTATEIPIDEDGRLSKDLPGFFEEDFQESLEHLRAIVGKGK